MLSGTYETLCGTTGNQEMLQGTWKMFPGSKETLPCTRENFPCTNPLQILFLLLRTQETLPGTKEIFFVN